MEYIAKNPQIFNINEDNPIAHAIQQHLSILDKEICKAILKTNISK